MVRLNKHAHWGDPAFTNKTGGGNSEANVVERMDVYKPRKRELERLKRNRWCCPHNKTNSPTGMRKCSVCVREVALKS